MECATSLYGSGSKHFHFGNYKIKIPLCGRWSKKSDRKSMEDLLVERSYHKTRLHTNIDRLHSQCCTTYIELHPQVTKTNYDKCQCVARRLFSLQQLTTLIMMRFFLTSHKRLTPHTLERLFRQPIALSNTRCHCSSVQRQNKKTVRFPQYC